MLRGSRPGWLIGSSSVHEVFEESPSWPTARTMDAHPALRGRVLPYFTCQLGDRPFIRYLVPDGSVDLVFSLDDMRGERPGAIEPDVCVAGMVTAPVSVRRPAGSLVIGVSFAPGCASEFLGVPVHQLNDQVCDLRELWGPSAGELLDRLREATPGARPALLDACSCASARPRDRPIRRARRGSG